MKLGLLLTAVSVLALLTGCSGDVTGTATAGHAEAFDPCTIPDDAIAAAGLDPATKSNITDDGYITPGWDICSWEASSTEDWYYLSASFSRNFNMDDVRNNPHNSNFAPASIVGREAVYYHNSVVAETDICDIAFQTKQGLATFSATSKERGGAQEDLCNIVRKHADELSVALPPS